MGLRASVVVTLKPAQPALRCAVTNGEPQIKRRQDKINDVANSGCVQKKYAQFKHCNRHPRMLSPTNAVF